MIKRRSLRTKILWGEDPEGCGPRNYFRESQIIENLRKYKKKGKILDAGCGNGTLSIRLAEAGYDLNSIDLSKRSISFFYNKIKKLNLDKKIKIRQESILKMSYPSDSFDGIVCGEVLEHLKNDVVALREFNRVLKKRGICVVTVPAKMGEWDFVDDASGHMRRYEKEELSQRFERAGFSIIKCFYWGFPLTNLWHNCIYKPFLEKQMRTGFKVSSSDNIAAKILKSPKIIRYLSSIFFVDKLFTFTNFGNSLLVVARK